MDQNKIAIETYKKIASIYSDQYFNDLSDTPYIDKFLSKLKSGSNILDVGCGPGQFSKYMISKGFTVEGIDFTKEMIKIAKEKVPEGKFKYMDMRDLDYKSESFEGMLVAYSLIHIPSKEIYETLKGFKRILKHGGYILIIAQRGKADQIVEETLKDGARMFINFFKPEDLKNHLTMAGFKVVYSETTDTNDPDSMSDKVNYIIGKK
jgi:ubiquinone/menaquinone biosynthesis C-methylase UbiE